MLVNSGLYLPSSWRWQRWAMLGSFQPQIAKSIIEIHLGNPSCQNMQKARHILQTQSPWGNFANFARDTSLSDSKNLAGCQPFSHILLQFSYFRFDGKYPDIWPFRKSFRLDFLPDLFRLLHIYHIKPYLVYILSLKVCVTYNGHCPLDKCIKG